MTINKEKLKVISTELDAGEIKSGSFLERFITLVDKYSDEKTNESTLRLKNCNIETCDEKTLEKFGNTIGLERLTIPVVKTRVEDRVFFIESTDGNIFPQFLDGVKIFEKGKKVYFQKIIITIDEDVYLQSGVSKIYINCTTTVTSSYVFTSDSLVRVAVENSYLGYVNIGATYDINYSYIEESISAYRLRLLSEKVLEKTLTIDSVKSYLMTIDGINSIYIKNNLLFFSTKNMFDYGNDINSDIYKKILISELTRILPWPISLDVIEKDRVDIIVEYTRYSDDTSVSNETINSSIYSYLQRVLVGNQDELIKKELDDYIFQYTGVVIVSTIKLIDNKTNATIVTNKVPYDTYVYIDISNIGVQK